MPPFRRLGCALAAVAATALSGGPAATSATARDPLTQRLARALAVPNVQPWRSSAVAFDLATGKSVFARNTGLPLVPASNEKLAVAYAALSELGPEFRIETTVLGEGELDGTDWHGNLVLKGYGDPTLSRADLRQLAAELRADGVRAVTGRVLGDESFFDARRTALGWRSYFYVNESPPISALTVDRARLRGSTSRQPALAAAVLFRGALREAGISVLGKAGLGKASPAAVPLASSLSPPIAGLVGFMGRESDNFTAEVLMKQLGALETGRGTTPAGAAVVMRLLAADGVPLNGVRLADGSGLSGLNRLTANALVGILKAAWADPELRPTFLRSLPVAGRTGTLERRLRGPLTAGRVRAKTGTTRQASALSGFVEGRFAFAVLHNGSPVSHWWARRAQDRFAAVLAAQ